jgi:hypothetical protein
MIGRNDPGVPETMSPSEEIVGFQPETIKAHIQATIAGENEGEVVNNVGSVAKESTSLTQ